MHYCFADRMRLPLLLCVHHNIRSVYSCHDFLLQVLTDLFVNAVE